MGLKLALGEQTNRANAPHNKRRTKSMKELIKVLVENTGYIFFAVVIASIVVRILQLIDKFLF